jgi:hypothetical protein
MREALTELESKAKQSTTLDDVLKKLNSKPEGEGTNNQSGLDPESVRSLVIETLQGETQGAKRINNRNAVNTEVLTKFGGDAVKAREFIVNRLKEVQMDPTTFKELTETSPAAALRLIDINTTQSKGSSSPNSYANVNTEAPPINPNATRNQSYYTELRKKMGTSKFFADTRLQQQVLKDVQALGKDYYK